MIIIPINNEPNQKFSVTIPVNGQNLTLDFFAWWNGYAGYWELNISDPQAGIPLICGLPLVSGDDPAINILRPYAYLGIGSAYLAYLSPNSSADYPGETDWNTNFWLIWGDNE